MKQHGKSCINFDLLIDSYQESVGFQLLNSLDKLNSGQFSDCSGLLH